MCGLAAAAMMTNVIAVAVYTGASVQSAKIDFHLFKNHEPNPILLRTSTLLDKQVHRPKDHTPLDVLASTS